MWRNFTPLALAMPSSEYASSSRPCSYTISLLSKGQLPLPSMRRCRYCFLLNTTLSMQAIGLEQGKVKQVHQCISTSRFGYCHTYIELLSTVLSTLSYRIYVTTCSLALAITVPIWSFGAHHNSLNEYGLSVYTFIIICYAHLVPLGIFLTNALYCCGILLKKCNFTAEGSTGGAGSGEGLAIIMHLGYCTFPAYKLSHLSIQAHPRLTQSRLWSPISTNINEQCG